MQFSMETLVQYRVTSIMDYESPVSLVQIQFLPQNAIQCILDLLQKYVEFLKLTKSDSFSYCIINMAEQLKQQVFPLTFVLQQWQCYVRVTSRLQHQFLGTKVCKFESYLRHFLLWGCSLIGYITLAIFLWQQQCQLELLQAFISF